MNHVYCNKTKDNCILKEFTTPNVYLTNLKCERLSTGLTIIPLTNSSVDAVTSYELDEAVELRLDILQGKEISEKRPEQLRGPSGFLVNRLRGQGVNPPTNLLQLR